MDILRPARARPRRYVSILKGNTKEIRIYTFLAILYLVPRRKVPFIFRQRRCIIALSGGPAMGAASGGGGRGLQENVRKQAPRRIFQNMIADEAHTVRCARLCVRY